MNGSNSFYEIYTFPNDSTLVITAYARNGKDNTKTSTATLRRKGGLYNLRDAANCKVSALSGRTVFMEALFRAFNTILWKKEMRIPGKQF